MLNRRSLLLGGTALVAATTIASAPFAASGLSRALAADSKVGDDVIACLKANALPLATAEPGSGFQDLEPFRSMVGNARIVSMGEATHGTREFFQLKQRLIEFCVAKLGFTIIGFEITHGHALAVNDYVLRGTGNAADVVAGMGFPWDTEEVVTLVEWVRAWNLANERKVKFYGFDMQSRGAELLHLLAYLERVAPELAAASARNLAPLASIYTDKIRLFSAAAQETILAEIKTVLDAFTAERARWTEQSSEVEWHLARHSAVVLDQEARYDGSLTFRDRCMADNVRALLDMEGPGAKALLWAHNAHVQRSPLAGHTMMGNFLHAAFGAEHVVAGFAFNQGGFRARSVNSPKVGSHAVGPAPDGYLDAALASTGIPLLALDLRRVPADGAVARWMASKPKQRLITGEFAAETELEYDQETDPRDNFDIVLFVERTTAARGEPPRTLPNVPVVPFQVTESTERPTNLALAGSNAIPDGWHQVDASVYPFGITLADEASPSGRRAVRLAHAASPLAWGEGALTQSFSAAPWRGRRLVFSAAMRAEAARIGTGAQLVVLIWPKRKEGSASYPIMALQTEGPVRSPEWTRRSVAVDVPVDAERVQITLVAIGNGAHWFGDLALDAMDSTPGATAGAHAKREAIGAPPADSVLGRLPWSSDRWR